MAGLLNESDVGANGQHLRISGWSKCTLVSFYSKVVCEHSFALSMFNFCKLYTIPRSFSVALFNS